MLINSSKKINEEDNAFKPFKQPMKDHDSFNLSLDMGNGRMSIDERRREISDYYNVFKIEINKEYFLNKVDNSRQRRNSAKFISINQKNAFNFDLENREERNKRTSIMNTSIDQINMSIKLKEGQEKNADYSIDLEIEKRKLSGFFTGPKDSNQKEGVKKSALNIEKNIYSNEITNYQNFPETKYKPSHLKPKFSLDVNEYPAPKKITPEIEKQNSQPKNQIKYKHMMKTQFALYNNKIMENPNSKGGSPNLLGEKTISSKIHPSPNMRSNSLHNESKNQDKFITSMVQNQMHSHCSNNSQEHYTNTFQKINNPEHLNNLLQNQTPVPIQNKSMFPNRHTRLHQSNCILPNSENIRISKIRPKASLQSNVPQIRFQNYQTIASLKSEMNLKSRKNNYKKKQRQVLKNFRHPQSPFGERRQAFKSSSSIESGDSDQEMNLEKAYCTICGEDFG